MSDKQENDIKHYIPLKKRPYLPKNDEIDEVHTRNATETTQAEVLNNEEGRNNRRENNFHQIRVKKMLEERKREEEREREEKERACETVNQNEWYAKLKHNHEYSRSVKNKIKRFKLETFQNQIGTEKCEIFLNKVDSLREEILCKVNNALHLKEMKLKSVQEEFNVQSLALMSEYEGKMEQLLSEVKSEVQSSQIKLKKTPKLKVPVQVEPPFIVYQLREEEIVEDLTIIRKAIADK